MYWLYVFVLAIRQIQGEEQFHSKNYLLEIPCSHAKMRLKGASQKLNFEMEKAISKSYTLDCSCKCPSRSKNAVKLTAFLLARTIENWKK